MQKLILLLFSWVIVINASYTQDCNNLRTSNITFSIFEEYTNVVIDRERYSVIHPREAETRYRKAGNTNWIHVNSSCTFSPGGFLEPYDFHCTATLPIGNRGEQFEVECRIRCDVEGWGPWVRKSFRTPCQASLDFLSNDDIEETRVTIHSAFSDEGRLSQDAGQSFFRTNNFNNELLVFNNLFQNEQYWYQHRVHCDDNTWSRYTSLDDFKTDCFSPRRSDLFADVNMNSKLHVSCAKSANLYQFQMREQGTSQWTSSNEQENSEYTFPPTIEAGKIYEIQCRVACGRYNEWTDYSDSKEFMLPVDCPEPQHNDIGANSITNHSAHFFCNSGHGSGVIDQHVFRYREKDGSIWEEKTASNNRVDVTQLIENTEYVMQVRHECTNGVNGNWSPSVNFVTDPSCNVNESAISIRNIEHTSVTLVCEQTERDGYTWDVRRVSDGNRVNIPNPILENRYILNNLDVGTEYEVKLKVHCDPVVSDFTESVNFTTLDCESPDPSSYYATDISNTSAVLSYLAVLSFPIEWQYRKLGNTNWRKVVSSTSEILLDSLVKNETYEYRLRLTCADNPIVYSDWGEIETFLTTCEGFITRFSNVTHESVTAHSNNANANSYFFKYKRVDQSNWTEMQTTDNQITVNSLLPDTEYEFQVRPSCDGNPGEWSSSEIIETEDVNPPPCIAPLRNQLRANSITAHTADLTCTKGNVDGFYFKYSDGGAPIESGLIQSGIYQAQNLAASRIYGFQCKVQCGAITSNWSDTILFRTDAEVFGLASACFAPQTSNLFSLNIGHNSAIVICTVIADQYQYRYKDTSASNWIELSPDSTQRLLLTGLDPSTGYEFQCRIQCNSSFGAYSASKYFNTLSIANCDIPAVSNFYASRIGANEVTFASANQAKLYQFRYKKLGEIDWNILDTTSQFFSSVLDLEAETEYMYQLRMLCVNNKISDYSSSKFFRTLPGCVVNVDQDMEAHTISSSSAYLKSNKGQLLGIAFRFRKIGDLNWTIVRSILSNEIKIENLSMDSRYEYQMLVVCTQKTRSQWSSSKEFMTLKTLGSIDVEESAWKVFPNPNDGIFTLSNAYVQGEIHYTLYDIIGNLVTQGIGNMQKITHFAVDLRPGIYYVNIFWNNKKVIKQIVIL